MIDCMTDELTRLRSEIAEAKAERDVAQAQYDELAPAGERLLAAIAEHRATAAELASATDDQAYAERLTAQASLEAGERMGDGPLLRMPLRRLWATPDNPPVTA